jgi:hypothetical protein
MPEENDWILNGLGFDPSLVRDYMAYYMSLGTMPVEHNFARL